MPVEQLRAAIHAGREGRGGWLELGAQYGGPVKPDIVFFGEELPPRCMRQHRPSPRSWPRPVLYRRLHRRLFIRRPPLPHLGPQPGSA